MKALFLTALLLLHAAIDGAQGLSAAHLVLPTQATVGSEVKMACTFELDENEVVYSIKWFKDEQLFLTVTPNDRPQLKVINLPGIVVDRKSTAYNKLVLSRADLETSGTYRCVVDLDGPSFASARSTKVLRVVKQR